jgi:hypothetical protein
LCNGAPFKDWDLPIPITELRGKLLKKLGGDRQFVTVLNAIRSDGLEAVTVACELALEANAVSGDYVLNALNRFKPQPFSPKVETPDGLRLKEEPKADVARYDRLLKKLALAAHVAGTHGRHGRSLPGGRLWNVMRCWPNCARSSCTA